MGTDFFNPQLLAIPAIGAILAVVAGCSAGGSSTSEPAPTDSPVERLTAHIEKKGSFNPAYFTQGLEVDTDGSLLVGTGQYGESGIYRVDPATMKVKDQAQLPADYFGEGITRTGDTIWQLTWKAGKAIKRDAATLQQTGEASYTGEGWGLCAFDDELIMSDGTAELRHLDPSTFEERSRTAVTLEGKPLEEINELECANGQVYANVWFTQDIYRIDPSTGKVTAVIDASGIPNNAGADENNVLNGIAHIPGTEEFYLTGKRWPDLYTVSFR